MSQNNIEQNNISCKILRAIEEKHINPQKRWVFTFKNYLFFGFFVSSVIVGSLAVSTIIFLLTDYDWQLSNALNQGFLSQIFWILPYFWLVVFLLFIVSAYYTFRSIKGGYKYAIYLVALISASLSVVFGSILFFAGVDSQVHEFFSANVPFYDSCVCDKKDAWNNPSKGVLAGEVAAVESQYEFTLIDFHNNLWDIETQTTTDWVLPFFVEEGAEIKLVGEDRGNGVFLAGEIELWDDDYKPIEMEMK